MFAKEQLILFLREWYMHPSGQLPAYEFALRRRQPARPCLGLLAGLQDDRAARARDRLFLTRVFQKLLINFTWWVNSQGRDGQASLRRRFLGLGQHRPVRSFQAVAQRRRVGAGRRNGMDGLLLRHHAGHGPGIGQGGCGL